MNLEILAYRILNKIKHEALRYKIKKADFKFGLNDTERAVPIIISLTSFPARFGDIELCLKSLLLQEMKPDHIIVWLGSDSANIDINVVFEKYKKYGIEFVVDLEHDYKSHKKYLYAFANYPEALVITVDDDLIYPTDLVSSLYETYQKYPNAVVARRVHKITWDSDKHIEPYISWEGEYNKILTPSHMLFATTGAGTLFPPHCIPDVATNVELILHLAFTTDDVWLKFMEVLNGTKVVWAKNNLQMPTTIERAQIIALRDKNVGESQNDVCIEKLMTYFGISFSSFEF